MYCEHCGREIQIVPEFEAEIENSIHATLSTVATEIAEPLTEESHTSEKAGDFKKSRFAQLGKRTRLLLAGGFALAFTVCLAGIVALIFHFMPSHQYHKALDYLKEEKYETAAACFERAVSLSSNNISYLNGLSNCYYLMGRLEEAKEICLEIISLEGSNEEAYRRFVSIGEKQQDYEGINRLMQGCKDQEIRTLYLDYMANPPVFDVPGGTYHEIQTVKLIGNAAGTIYYSTDGSVPDETSSVYTVPFTLESGSHTICAFFVNQYGVKSQTVTQSYVIDVSKPEAPLITPASGIYDKPQLVEAEVPEGCKVYYTTDKSDPGSGSTLYTEPFWMPAGNSTLRFVAVSESGVAGEITSCQYTLDLHAVLSMEAASNQLLLMLKNAGIVSSLQGAVPGMSGRNLYTYKYALTINDHHYYLYREYYEEADKTSNATGNDYVVNYMSGECYRAVMQKDRTFKLYNIDDSADVQKND